MIVNCRTFFEVPQTQEGKEYIDVVEEGYKPIASYTKRTESTTAIILETLVSWEIGQSEKNTTEYTIEAEEE